MRRFALCLVLAGCAAAPPRPAPAPAPPPKLNVLVVTGGHGFKAPPFFRMFDEDPDITYVAARQDQAAEAYERPDLDRFDVVVLYDSPSKITEAQQARFRSLLKRGAGLVVLHHALLSYQDWPEYAAVVGGKYALDDVRVGDKVIPGSDCAKDPGQKGCKNDVSIAVDVAAPAHPTTAGLASFTLVDELYTGLHMGGDITPLLRAGDEVLAWTRQEGRTRVVATLLGHGPPAYENPGFVRFLRQSIVWAANR